MRNMPSYLELTTHLFLTQYTNGTNIRPRVHPTGSRNVHTHARPELEGTWRPQPRAAATPRRPEKRWP
eukprot:520271-Prymnesium_polylepis.1